MQHIIEDVFDEIQASNMSKLGDDGKPVLREDGKILKGPGYFRPDLSKFIETE
jgi:predicted HAD superfamily Cof-like phosphohydrolase